jgi:spore coat protein CotH
MLLVRRLVIIGGLILALVALDATSEENLLLSLPDEIDVIQALLDRQVQRAAREEAINDYYDRLVDAQEDEQRRLEEEAEAIRNAYTLEDRDKEQDYLTLFDHSVEHTFIVDITSAEWQGLIDDMELYHSVYGTYRSNNYRKVQVTYTANGETIEIPDVGIRSKGNVFSRVLPINSQGDVRPIHYVLKFNETFDTIPGTEAYDLLKTREVFNVEKLAFKWNRNFDPSYLSEVYSMQVFRDAGVPAPNMTLTRFILRIDGRTEMEELYTVQEVMDEEFIRIRLQDTPTDIVGDLYKVIWPGTLEPITDMSLVGIRDWVANHRPVYGLETNDDEPDYSQLIDFTYGLSIADLSVRRQFIESTVDVDMLLRALAASVLLGNPDDYRGNANNYYIYFDLEGVFHYLPYDFDHSLGQGWDGAPVFIDYSLGNDIYIWEGDGFSAQTRNIPLVDNILLAYEDYQIQYENYLEQFVTDGTFSYEGFSDLFELSYLLYGDDFWMENNKAYYINTKITNVLEDVQYYRNQR